MDNDSRGVDAIFLAALEKKSPEERSDYLNEACGDDAELRRRVERLLAAHPSVGSFLETPGPNLGATAIEGVVRKLEAENTSATNADGMAEAAFSLDFLDPTDNPEHLGRLGPYEITEVIGRGGMGIVLKAHDPRLNRYVAIKLLSPQLASNAVARKRFTREAQAAAAVTHDHVVAIHSVDEINGLPLMVMEYVVGVSLADRIDRDGSLRLEEILRIGMQTASGLAAAHAQGLVHRDIKPSNILLENGVERVRITDFGLARAADDTAITQPGVVAGTPEYMSPEQARGETVDQRSDLFSLGCLLYAMCTGRSPFRASTVVEAIRRVCDDTPRPIAKTNAEVPDWLVRIIDRLLSKDPAERYQSASEVAELLEGCLAHLQQPSVVPMPARVGRGVGAAGHRTRWSGRPWAAAAAIFAIAALGLFVTESTGVTQLSEKVLTVLRIQTPEGTLVVEVDDPQVSVTVSGQGVSVAGAGPQQINLKPGRYKLVASKPTTDGLQTHNEWVTVTRGERVVVRARVVPKTSGAAAPPNAAELRVRVDSPGMEMVVHGNGFKWTVSGKERTVSVPAGRYDVDVLLRDGSLRREGWINLAARIPRNMHLDGFFYFMPPIGRQPEAVAELLGHRRAPQSVAFSPDGSMLATAGSDCTVRLWTPDGDTWRELAPPLEGHATAVCQVAFSADGEALATAAEDGVKLWDVRDVATGQARCSLSWDEPGSRCLAFHPAKAILACARGAEAVTLRNITTGESVGSVTGHTDDVSAVAFSPDGKWLATASRDAIVRLSPLVREAAQRELVGHIGPVVALAYSPDGKILASAGEDDLVRLWDVETGQMIDSLGSHFGWVRCMAFSPKGRLLATAADVESVKLWHVESRTLLGEFDAHWDTINDLAFSPDEKLLATASDDNSVRLWAVPDLPPPVSDKRPRLRTVFHTDYVTALAYSPAGGTLGYSIWAKDIEIYDLEDSRQDPRVRDIHAEGWDAKEFMAWPRNVAFLDDGRTIVSCGLDKTVRRFDVPARLLHEAVQTARPCLSLAVAPDETLLAIMHDDATVTLWDPHTWDRRDTLRTDRGMVKAIAFSPDGGELAAATNGGSIVFWDAATGRQQRDPLDHGNADVWSLAYSPDGSMLASGAQDTKLRLWDVGRGELLWQRDNEPYNVVQLGFSPDGSFLAEAGGVLPTESSSHDRVAKVRLWDVSSGALLSEFVANPLLVSDLIFLPDRDTLVTSGGFGTIYFWDISEFLADSAKGHD